MLDFQFKKIVKDDRSDKFTVQSVDVVDDQCHRCRHWTKGTMACQAFPNGIPLGFLTGELDHTLPYPGDNGVRYAPL